ncbi:antitermination protein N [Escherichia coli DEC15A]|nr:antitermination protein N [Escherichia coli DEC15A]EHY08896.1 antitermination protein N [Escherichia coli DEC15C]EHY16077.1 antitermination protein N [Escherichia coli DEC15D]EHY20016.1 antitermination protein N [Escherichia coli DEC15E]
MQWKYLPAKRSRLRGRLPEIKTIDGEMINSFANYLFLPCLS